MSAGVEIIALGSRGASVSSLPHADRCAAALPLRSAVPPRRFVASTSRRAKTDDGPRAIRRRSCAEPVGFDAARRRASAPAAIASDDRGSASPSSDDGASSASPDENGRWKVDIIEQEGGTRPTPLSTPQLLAFGIPALGALLADPLCSLVDTAVVGNAGQATGLAALGPNTAIFGCVAQLFSFLTTATTASVARLAGQRVPTGRYVSAALIIALVLGLVCFAALNLGAELAVASMSVPPNLAPVAAEYLRVRAASVPFLLLVTVCVAVCLGRRDPRSPLIAAGVASAVNVALDLFLVAGPPRAGVAGAAAATCAAQISAAAVLLRRVARDPEIPLRLTLPTREDFAPLVAAWPVALRSALLMVAVASVTAAASRLPVPDVAAHQICLTTLTLAQFLPEPVSQAAQAFLAKGAPGVENPEYARGSARTLLRATACVSALASATALVPSLAPRTFTADAAVAAATLDARSGLVLSCALLPWVCVTDGLLLARREYGFCTWVLATSAFATVAYLGGAVSWTGNAAAWGGPNTLAGVWWGFVLLQSARLTQNAARLWWISRREARDAGYAPV